MNHALPRSVRYARRLVAVAALALGLPAPLAAQNRPSKLSVATLEDLMKLTVTTATRTSEDLSKVPARMQVVTAEQIEHRGYRSLQDVLKDLVEFKVDIAGDQDYPVELTVDGIRSAGKVVVLLDGIRVSSPTNEPLPILANYPVHTARQIEIVYGPASALYGADAFSAVVNVITRDADDATGVNVQTTAGQYGLYNQTASFATRLGNNASLVVGGQAYYDRQPNLSRWYPEDFAGLESLKTGVFNSIFGPIASTRPVSPEFGNQLWAHSQHAALRAGGFQVTLFHSQSSTPNSMPTRPEDSVYNNQAYQKNELFVAAGTYTREIGRLTSTTLAEFSRHEMNPDSGYWNVFSNFTRSYKYAFGRMVKGEQQLSWKPRPSTTVTVGGTVERFFAIPQTADLNAPVESQDAPSTLLGTNIPDDFYRLHYSNSGLYAQAQREISPRLSVTAGARADYNTRYGGTFNPRVGLVAAATATTTLKVLYGTAFLAPSPYQAYAHYGSFVSDDDGKTFRSDYWHLPNPDLKPQQKKTIELNVAQSLGPAFHVETSAFYSRFSNLIQTADADQAYAGTYHGWPVAYIDFPVNEGKSTSYGATAKINFLRTFDDERRLEAYSALAVVDGRVWNDDSSDGHLRLGGMSPVQLRAGVDFDWSRWSVAPRLTVVGTQRVNATTQTANGLERLTIPGYATVDMTIRRRLGRFAGFVTVENALNRQYRAINMRAYTNPEEFVGAPQNPRRIAIGFELRSGVR